MTDDPKTSCVKVGGPSQLTDNYPADGGLPTFRLPSRRPSESSMKRALIITYYFPPAPLAYSQRIGKLCKYLPEVTDWLPAVMCGELPWDLLPGRDDALMAEIPAGVTVDPVRNFLASALASRLRKLHLYRPVNLIRKVLLLPDDFADWSGRVAKAADLKFPGGQGIQAIFCCGPPNSIYVAGLRLSRMWRKPLVIDMRDPWTPLYADQHQFLRWLARRTLNQERAVYQEAQGIIVNTDSAANELKRRYPELAAKLVIIPNGFDPEDLNWQHGPALRRPGEAVETVHILNLGGFRGTIEEAFLKILAAYLQDKPEERRTIKMHFVGANHDKIKKIVTELGLADICSAHGVVPTNAVGRPLAEADIYTLLQPEQHAHSIPSKFYYYLAGGGQIFAMVPERLATELGEILGHHDILAPANPDNGKAVLAGLLERARQNKRLAAGTAIPDYAQRFDRRAIARQVGTVLDRAAGPENLK